MSALVIYGIGGFAKMMRYYFDENTNHNVVAFCADRNFISEAAFDGLPVVPFETVQDVYSNNDHLMFVAVGYSKMRARKEMFEKAVAKNYRFANYISPLATVDRSVTLGVNNVILQGSQIEPFCEIANNNIIWSSVNISHNVIVQNNCFIASQSLVGGNTVIGNGSYLGFNCTVLQNILVGEESLIGAKSLVLKNTDPFSKNMGIPASCKALHAEVGIEIK